MNAPFLSFWTRGLNLTYVKRSYNAWNVVQTSYLRSSLVHIFKPQVHYVAICVAKLKHNLWMRKQLKEDKVWTVPSTTKDSITFSSMLLVYLLWASTVFNYVMNIFFRSTAASSSDFCRIRWNWILSFY